jgi:hypothetical protein
VLLVLDNFRGHLDWEAFELLHNNHVQLIGLPPKTSDLTQPLDLSVFGPLKIAYRKEFDKKLQECSINSLHQRDFVGFLKDAYKSSFTHDNICSGFSKAGLVPFNPYRILRQCPDWNECLYEDYVPKLNKSEKMLNELIERSEAQLPEQEFIAGTLKLI